MLDGGVHFIAGLRMVSVNSTFFSIFSSLDECRITPYSSTSSPLMSYG